MKQDYIYISNLNRVDLDFLHSRKIHFENTLGNATWIRSLTTNEVELESSRGTVWTVSRSKLIHCLIDGSYPLLGVHKNDFDVNQDYHVPTKPSIFKPTSITKKKLLIK